MKIELLRLNGSIKLEITGKSTTLLMRRSLPVSRAYLLSSERISLISHFWLHTDAIYTNKSSRPVTSMRSMSLIRSGVTS